METCCQQETHLQKALTAQQFYGTAEARTIPIPDVQCVGERYPKLYKADFKMSRQYIHVEGERHNLAAGVHCVHMWLALAGVLTQSQIQLL